MRNYARYIISVLFLIGMVVLIIVLFNVVRNIFKGDESKQAQTAKRINLVESARAGKPVVYTTKGVITGEDIHHEFRFTIDSSVRRIEALEGYNNNVIKVEELPNTQEAYNSFIG